jgi:periplasmic protein CpxP/Spy
MKSIGFRLMVAALAVLLGTALTQAQTADTVATPPAHSRHFGMGGRMMGFFADYLNLTDAQQTQMKTILQKERPTLKPLLQQERQNRTQLQQYAEGTYDEAKVQALATQQAQVEAQLITQRTRIHNELFQVLTPDQQAQMKQLEVRHEARMQKRRSNSSNSDSNQAPPTQEQ